LIRVDLSGLAVPRFSRKDIGRFVRLCVRELGRAGAVRGSMRDVAVHFLDDRSMAALNRRFRHQNKTTDVLTFPSDSEDDGDGPRHLGDIAISLPRASRQAREQRHALATEVRYLLLHGLIHALGFDHETDRGEMNALEMRMRERVGL